MTLPQMDGPPAERASVPAPQDARLAEVAMLFTRLGFTAFGGPAAHVALMEDEVVRRRAWLDRRHFLDLVSALNFIPGPNSTELAIHLGWVRAGLPGLVVAGVCFILPAVLIILPLAWAYVRFGTVPQVRHVLLSVNAAVIAVLLVTFWRLARTALTDPFTVTVAALAAAVAGVVAIYGGAAAFQPELLVLAVAAAAGALWYARPRAPALPLLSVVPLLGATTEPAPMGRLFLAMLKIGATLYGSGYVLVSYLRTTAVEQHGWLTERQLLDAVSVGQVTPGPLLTTATFAGYLVGHRQFGTAAGGVLGAAVATAGIFLPSFVLVALFARAITRLRHNRFARGALDAMNAAVAALILVVTLQLAVTTLGVPAPGHGGRLPRPDLPLLAVTALAAVALLRWRLNSTWVIAAAAAAGVARAALSSP